MKNDANELSISDLGMLRNEHLLFKDISFTLRNQQAAVIEGKNGSGKSTLLRILAGFIEPTAGDVLWNQASAKTVLQEKLHYVGHTNGLKFDLSVIENLQAYVHLTWQTPTLNLDDCLVQLNLKVVAHTAVRHLSAGQKRKIALARLLLIHQPLWLLDEPFASLDQASEQFFLHYLTQHLSNGGMAVIATHHTLPLTPTVTVRLGT